MFFRKKPSPQYLDADLRRLFEFAQKHIRDVNPFINPDQLLGVLIYLFSFQVHVVSNFTKADRNMLFGLSMSSIVLISEFTNDAYELEDYEPFVAVCQDQIRTSVGLRNWHPGIAESSILFHHFVKRHGVGEDVPDEEFAKICTSLGFGLVTTLQRDGYIKLR